MIRFLQCKASKNVILEPHIETLIPIYVKKEEIRDSDTLVFFTHGSIEDLNVDGFGASFDGVKLYVTLVNRGNDSITIKRGTYLGYILLEEERNDGRY